MPIYDKKPAPFLTALVKRLDPVPPLIGMCAGFEGGEWRCDQLADHILEWLPEFALTEQDLLEFGPANALRALRDAARYVYTSAKYGRRGEVGEILLHAIVRQEYGSVPLISKVFFKDSPNDTVKGFDGVHVVEAPDGLELWLGEVKLYKNAAEAVRDVVEELREHTRIDYLRTEFTAIWRKIDRSSPYRDALRPILEGRNTTMDAIFRRICIPVLLTYDSAAVAGHAVGGPEYVRAVLGELERHHGRFAGADLPQEVRILLMLVPVGDKAALLDRFDRKLKGLAGDSV